MRYLTHIYAIPLNDYILLKYPIVFIHLPWSRDRAVSMTSATSLIFRKIVVVEEQLYTEQYWHNNSDFIVQSVFTWKLILDPPFGSTICHSLAGLLLLHGIRYLLVSYFSVSVGHSSTMISLWYCHDIAKISSVMSCHDISVVVMPWYWHIRCHAMISAMWCIMAWHRRHMYEVVARYHHRVVMMLSCITMSCHDIIAMSF